MTNPRFYSTSEIIADRLRRSSNPAERRCLYAGRSFHQGFPVLLDTDYSTWHTHILGPPGSGKTSQGVNTRGRQMIARGDGPLVIFDGKGDMGLFNSVRHAAHVNGREFKWFTNRPSRSTYVFNPWDNRLMTRLTLTDILGLFIQSLNLHHGEDYGRSWFSVNHRSRLRQAILETIPEADKRNVVGDDGQGRLFPKFGPIQSFRDLHHILENLTGSIEESKAARHLALVVECLCDFDQLNLAPNNKHNDPALEHAIFMPEVIEKNQVIYFYLAGALDNVAVAEIARLAMYSLYTAAVDYQERHGTPPRVYTIWDEAQIMISKNIEYVLTQSRSAGVACILAHQAMDQLNPPGGVDLRALVMQCTHIKQVFGARDPWLMDYISRTSGTTRYYRRGYDVSADDAIAGCVDVAGTCSDRDGQRRVHVQEYTGPRISYQDILEVNGHPNLSLMSVDQPSGLCPFRGWFPMYTEWPIPLSIHKHYERYPWPKKTEATIEAKRLWPTDDVGAAKDSVTEDLGKGASKADDALDSVWEDLQRTRDH